MDNMGKGAILTGKNKEKVYPVTASDLVYDKDTRKNMKETLEEIKQAASSGIGEAPVDGNMYVRKNSAWSKLDDSEVCKISIGSDQGESDASSLLGVSVQVVNADNGTIYLNTTWQGNELACTIPAGNKYKIVCGSLTDFIKPANKVFESSSFGSRRVSMIYNRLSCGVFIQGISGKLYSEAEWNSQETPNGIAVITENCQFVIALTEASNTMRIQNSDPGTLDDYMTAISDETQAKADCNGATNTTNIMKLQSGTDYAAGWCNAFSFPSGKKGFLPSLGQMWAAYSNKSAIDAALTKTGGTALNSALYWTSTFWGVYSGYDVVGHIKSLCWTLNWSDGNVDVSNQDASNRVRAFGSL